MGDVGTGLVLVHGQAVGFQPVEGKRGVFAMFPENVAHAGREGMHQHQLAEVVQQAGEEHAVLQRIVQVQFGGQRGTESRRLEGLVPPAFAVEVGTGREVEGAVQGDADGDAAHQVESQHLGNGGMHAAHRPLPGEIGGIGDADDAGGKARVLFDEGGQLPDLDVRAGHFLNEAGSDARQGWQVQQSLQAAPAFLFQWRHGSPAAWRLREGRQPSTQWSVGAGKT